MPVDLEELERLMYEATTLSSPRYFKAQTELPIALRNAAPAMIAELRRIDRLVAERSCGEDTEYGRGWDAGVKAAQKWLKEGV
jgi:hypothetical protein